MICMNNRTHAIFNYDHQVDDTFVNGNELTLWMHENSPGWVGSYAQPEGLTEANWVKLVCVKCTVVILETILARLNDLFVYPHF